jgi:hypothetical protein
MKNELPESFVIQSRFLPRPFSVPRPLYIPRPYNSPKISSNSIIAAFLDMEKVPLSVFSK